MPWIAGAAFDTPSAWPRASAGLIPSLCTRLQKHVLYWLFMWPADRGQKQQHMSEQRVRYTLALHYGLHSRYLQLCSAWEFLWV